MFLRRMTKIVKQAREFCIYWPTCIRPMNLSNVKKAAHEMNGYFGTVLALQAENEDTTLNDSKHQSMTMQCQRMTSNTVETECWSATDRVRLAERKTQGTLQKKDSTGLVNLKMSSRKLLEALTGTSKA